MKKLISVIVPVYQAEKFLDRCLNSIISQTYSNLEIICIVDGATDGSYDICKKFAKIDERVIVTYQNNAGQSVARNKALDIAHGDYIAFVDSDDYIELDMIETLYREITINQCDMAMCSVYFYKNDGGIKIEKDYDNNVILNNQDLIEAGFKGKIQGYPCNKLIKSECLRNIRFIPNIKFEDLEWIPRLFTNIKTAVYIAKPLYHYCYNENSTVNSKERTIENLYYFAYALYCHCEYAKKHYEKYLKFPEGRFIISYFQLLTNKDKLVRFIDSIEKMQKYFDSLKIQIVIKNELIPLKERLKYILYSFSHRLFFIVHNLLK